MRQYGEVFSIENAFFVLRLLVKPMGKVIHTYPPLIAGRLILRYKRFLCDVRLDGTGEVVTCHLANPGSMLGMCVKHCEVRLSEAAELGKRKHKFTVEAVKVRNDWVGCNTMLANRVLKRLFADKEIPESSRAIPTTQRVVSEYKLGNRRFDFAVVDASGKLAQILEAKTVTMASDWYNVETQNECARDKKRKLPTTKPPECEETMRSGLFPDSESKRASEHLLALKEVANRLPVHLVYFVSRGDVDRVLPSVACDPRYAAVYADFKKQTNVFIHALLVDFQMDDSRNSRLLLRDVV